jgi:hypothetical protein
MKKIFSKIISIIVITGAITAVSGFCAQMWFGDNLNIHPVHKVLAHNQDNVLAMADTCNEAQDSVLPIQTQSQSQTPLLSATQLPFSSSNNLMPCCLDNSGHISASIITSQFDFSNSLAVISNYSESIFPVINKETIPNQPILSPPQLLAISSTIIRV